MYSRVPPRELYERTGIQLMPINTIFELAAMAAEADPALDDADTLLLIPDLLHHWLCGGTVERVHERDDDAVLRPARGRLGRRPRSSASTSRPRLLPEVVPPGTPLGRATPRDRPARRVIAVATHDTGSAVAAVPFREPDSAFLSVGTWSLVGLEVDEPLITDETFAANLTNEGGVAGTFRLLRNVTGLWLLHECRRSWAVGGPMPLVRGARRARRRRAARSAR